MTELAWPPWYRVVKIRPDLEFAELLLDIFAAQLNDVAMGNAGSVCQLPHRPIELPPSASDERSLLESISNHIAAKPASADDREADMFKAKEA